MQANGNQTHLRPAGSRRVHAGQHRLDRLQPLALRAEESVSEASGGETVSTTTSTGLENRRLRAHGFCLCTKIHFMHGNKPYVRKHARSLRSTLGISNAQKYHSVIILNFRFLNHCLEEIQNS